jgi:Flp pilus assembly protein CpaB
MNRRRLLIAIVVLAVAVAASYALVTYVRRQRTVADAVAIYGTAARAAAAVLRPRSRRLSAAAHRAARL